MRSGYRNVAEIGGLTGTGVSGSADVAAYIESPKQQAGPVRKRCRPGEAG